jgi:outer membrane receptor protein involved in Fe transport
MNQTHPRNPAQGFLAFACASFLATVGASMALAQAVPAPKVEKAAEPAVELSPFVVKEEVTDSYQARQTVVGSRTAKDLASMPTSITVITAQQIKDLNAVEVSQVLAVGVSGVTRNQTINDDVNIRGFRTSQSLRNGVTKTSFKRNPMFDVERIEVVKGPGALILGNNSFLGGGVNFVSMRASATPGGSIQTTLGSNNSLRLAANVTGPAVKSEDFRMNYRFTVGGQVGDRDKEIEDQEDQKFIGGGLAMYFGNNISLFVNGYYFKDDGYFYWEDFLDVSGTAPTLKTLANAKLNQYSGKSFSPGRKRDAFWKNQDSFIDVTALARLTENGNLRAYYFASNLVDRRRIVRGITMRADNFTLDRQDIPLVIDNYTHNAQIDYLHRYATDFFALDTTIGVDGAYTFSRQGQSVNAMPALDTRSTSFPNDDTYFSVPRPGAGLANLQDTGSKATTFSYYFQENLSFLQERLVLVGGLRWFSPGGTNENYVTKVVTNRPDTVFRTHKYGAVVKILPNLSAYYTDAQNIFLQTGFTDKFAANDQLGPPLDNQEGKLSEYGLKYTYEVSNKVSLFATVANFDMELTNVRTFGDLGNGVQGIIQSRQDKGKGWEYDLGMRLGAGDGNFDVIVTYFDGESAIAADPTVQSVDFVPRKYSFLGKYSWTGGALKGFAIGGSLMDQTAKRNGNYLIDFPRLINLFATYRWSKNWEAQVNIDNVTDERYIVAIAATGLVQTADLRIARVAVKYSW